MNRRIVIKSWLWILAGIAAAVTWQRFSRGLGATTALSDSTPWGLWIGFDVMSGVALAAGGFVIAALVYVFHLERFRPFLRAAILTAFLGYLAVAVGLFYDLGIPWHIYYPAIPSRFQPASVLFEVAWCVMLYLTVLGLEFAPAVMEHQWLQWRPLPSLYRTLNNAAPLLVIAGIMLSTLHQNSLGALFLIMPYRIHPLWYSPIMHLHYLVSAIGLGLMIIILENIISAWLYRHTIRTDLLSGLARGASFVLTVYAGIRVVDLFMAGKLPLMFDGSWQSRMFIGEMLIGACIPASLMSFQKLRERQGFLLAASLMTVAGMVLYRLNCSFIMVNRAPGTSYFPSLAEFGISLGIVAVMGLIFLFCVENLHVFDHDLREKDAGASREFLSRYAILYLTLFLLSAGLAAFFAPKTAAMRFAARQTSVAAAKKDDAGQTLIVNGDLDRDLVIFPHRDHQANLGGNDSCISCHHLNLPGEKASSCSKCHRDMFLPTIISVRNTNSTAPSYKEAMHGSCRSCHAQTFSGKYLPELRTCAGCHGAVAPLEQR